MSLEKGTYGYDFQAFIEEVYLFNDIADSARDITKITLEDIKNQYKVVLEEVKETGEAIEENNPVKVLDGVVDSFVTLLGLAKQLEESGFDVLGACQQVAFDNLQKFPTEEDIAKASVDSLVNKGVNAQYVESEIETFEGTPYVILNGNNKVLKPINFKATDLSEYVPYYFNGF
jgi:hypothetical protein